MCRDTRKMQMKVRKDLLVPGKHTKNVLRREWAEDKFHIIQLASSCNGVSTYGVSFSLPSLFRRQWQKARRWGAKWIAMKTYYPRIRGTALLITCVLSGSNSNLKLETLSFLQIEFHCKAFQGTHQKVTFVPRKFYISVHEYGSTCQACNIQSFHVLCLRQSIRAQSSSGLRKYMEHNSVRERSKTTCVAAA